MSSEDPHAVRFVLAAEGAVFTAILPGRASEIEITLEEYKAISHAQALHRIASAIDSLADAVNGLADVVRESAPPEGQ